MFLFPCCTKIIVWLVLYLYECFKNLPAHLVGFPLQKDVKTHIIFEVKALYIFILVFITCNFEEMH